MPYANYDNNNMYGFSPHLSLPEEPYQLFIHSVHSCSSARVIIIQIYDVIHVQLSSTLLDITIQPALFFVNVPSVSSGRAIISTPTVNPIVYVYSSPSSAYPCVTHQTYINGVSSCINSSGSSTSEPSTYLFIHLSYE